MLKITILSCPNCDCVWDQEEIEEGTCGACGYPNNDDETDDDPVGYECCGCGTSRGHPGICPICDNPMEPYY